MIIKTSKLKCLIVFLPLYFCGLIALRAQVTESFRATPLIDVFEVFSKKYELLLAYDPDILQNQYISINLREQDILSAFYQVLDQADLEYITVGTQKILIRPAVAAPPPPPLSYHTLKGYVRDRDSKEGLAFATVHCPQFGWGTTTDTNGYFQIRWPDTIKQKFTLEARYLGYETQSLHYAPGNNSKSLHFSVLPSPHAIGMVIVVDELPAVGISSDDQALVIRPDEHLPSLGGQVDVIRNLQLLPGVAAFNDQSAALQVRGSQAEENLMMWDGMLLYEVDHFFGVFGAVNAELVESVKLYKNTFPISYGGRTASVLDIQSHQEKKEPATHLSVGSLLLEGAHQQALGKGMFLQIGGRSSLNNIAKSDLFQVLDQEVNLHGGTLAEILESSEQIQVIPAFKFYDANAKWSWQVNPDTYLDLNAYRSEDHYDYNYSVGFRSRLQNRILSHSATFGEEGDWSNAAYSLRWMQQWHKRWRSELSVGYSSYSIFENALFQLQRERPDQGVFTSTHGNIRENVLEGYHINWKHEVVLSDIRQLTLGIRSTTEAVDLNIENDSTSILSNNGEQSQLAFYAAHNWKWQQWQLQLGIHTTYYDGTKQLYGSPRLLANYQIDAKWRLKASINLYHQFLRRYYHENRFGRSFNIWTLADGAAFPVAHTWQSMAGFNFSQGNFSLDLEAYYKYTEGVLEHTTVVNQFEAEGENGGVAGGQGTYRISRGNGKVLGVDIMIRQEWQHFSTLFSYTLSKSTRQFDDLFKGVSYASQDDRPHQLQWTNQYKTGRWSFSAVYQLASGRPYLDLSVSGLNADRRNRSENSLRRIPDYHRVDLAARYAIPFKKGEAYIGGSVFNLFDRDNTLYSQRIYSVASENNLSVLLGNELQLLGRTISFSAGIRF